MELKNKSLTLVTRNLINFVIVTISILLSLLVNVPYGDCYSSGAPNSPGICNSMIPGHGPAPQTSPVPYTIKLDKTKVNGGEKVTVTLMGSNPFKGFFAMGRKKDFQNNKVPQGTIIEASSGIGKTKLVTCHNAESASITHTNNDEKRQVQFEWVPPNEDDEYVILTSFVESHDVFWTEHSSEVIKVKRNVNLQAAPAPTAPAKVISAGAQKIMNDIYDNCGSDKGCFGFPSGCVGNRNCKVVTSFQTDGENVAKFHLGGEDMNGYLAVGLSKDDQMGEDVIFACKPQANNAAAYFSTGETHPTPMKNDMIKNFHTNNVDGYLTCDFNVKPADDTIAIQGATYNLKKDKIHILLATGGPGGDLSYHDITGRSASSESVRLSDKVTLLAEKSSILIQLHGSLMIMAWLLCASTGMFTARYFKQTHVDVKPCGVMFWFALHRVCMVLTVLMSLTASVLIFVEIKGYTEAPEGAIAEYYHPILGIVLSSLAVLQVLIALCRPAPKARNRYMFNWVHWIIGNTAHILGIACIFLANDLNKTNLKGKTGYWGVLTAFIVFHVFFHIVMSIHTLRADKQMEIQNKKRAVLPGPMKLSGLDAEAPGTGLRSAMLTIYILGAASTAGVLVYYVVSSLNEV